MTAAATTPPARRAGGSARRAVTVTAAVALAGVLLATLGIVLAARPVHTPTQDCGSAAAFLMRGDVDELVDPDDPPAGITAAEARNNNDTPCQERAANQARPGGFLVAGGTALAVASLLAEVVVRLRHRRRGARTADPASPAS